MATKKLTSRFLTIKTREGKVRELKDLPSSVKTHAPKRSLGDTRKGNRNSASYKNVGATALANVALKRIKNARILGYKNFTEYLRSDVWKSFVKSYFEEHAKECRICKSDKYIRLRHRHYDTIGKEIPRDVVPMCDTCFQAGKMRQFR